MKNIFKTALASLLLMASCATDEEFVIPTSTPDTFYASIEAPETRTYADEDGKLLWTANDQITIFKGNTTPLTYQFTGETGKNYGGFKNVTPESGDEFVTSNPLDANHAIYPHVTNTTISNAGVINFTIPATQSYAENSFGLGANVMVAVTENKSDNNLSFKNLGGYFEFSLYGEGTTVKSIEFKGNNSEDLAGAAAITATYNGTPTFEFTGNTSKTLTLDCGAGVELGTEANPTKFWFVVPAIEYTKGITITITDTEGGVMEKSTSKSITIDRSTVQPLNAFLVETVIPNNQIRYTATSKVEPSAYADFGATIESNEWDSNTGKGIITFDGDITSISTGTFQNRDALTKITIPNSVTSILNYAFDDCSNLVEVILPNNISAISDYAFQRCSKLENITIPDNVSSIGKYAFNYCTSLSSINIPAKVTTIGSSAFSGCSALQGVYISDLAAWCKMAFTYDRNPLVTGKKLYLNGELVTELNIPEGIESISAYAFYNCTTIESLTIPSSVQSIGSNAFFGCTSLTTVYCTATTPPTLAGSALGVPASTPITKVYVPVELIDIYKANWTGYAKYIEAL